MVCCVEVKAKKANGNNLSEESCGIFYAAKNNFRCGQILMIRSMIDILLTIRRAEVLRRSLLPARSITNAASRVATI